MATPRIHLAFFKLNVPEIVPALAFWRDAFGFDVVQTFDEPEFLETILALPGQPNDRVQSATFCLHWVEQLLASSPPHESTP